MEKYGVRGVFSGTSTATKFENQLPTAVIHCDRMTTVTIMFLPCSADDLSVGFSVPLTVIWWSVL